MAASGQAMVDDITSEVTYQGSTGEDIHFPETTLGSQQSDRLHMSLDVNIVTLSQEVIQAQPAGASLQRLG